MPQKKTSTSLSRTSVRNSLKHSTKQPTTNKEKNEFSFVSYSSSSIVSPYQNIHKELVFQNNSGKIKGSYVEEKNGKTIVSKEFKSKKGYEAVQKLLEKPKR